MSVIRTLSASESNEQREREKAKLEKEFKRSDQRLDELISLHHNDLTQVMQVLSGVFLMLDLLMSGVLTYSSLSILFHLIKTDQCGLASVLHRSLQNYQPQ